MSTLTRATGRCGLWFALGALLGCGDGGTGPAPLQYTRLVVASDAGSTEGIYDPSIVYPQGGSVGFLTYTSVPNKAAVHSRAAASTDSGRSWVFVGDVNTDSATTITTTGGDTAVCGATTCTGVWVHETSSLVYDPTDPDTTQRFKVFVHSYFVALPTPGHDTTLAYWYGNLSMYTTSFPTRGWSSEVKLLGWNSTSPVSSTGVRQNISTDPALASGYGNCWFIMEPGALVRGDTIDLATGCVQLAAGLPFDIRMMRSTDHGATWRFIAVLLDSTDALAVGSSTPRINGADLFRVGSTTYLFATPEGPLTAGGYGYRGCLEFRFANVDAGQLVRSGGVPVVQKRYTGDPGIFTGPCTADAGAKNAGVIVPKAGPTFSPYFQIFTTGVGPP